MATAEELITRTVHGCFEGWYDADVARMDRALHPDLVERSPIEDGGAVLTKDAMLQARAEGEGTRAAGRWLRIDIVDVCGGIASAVARSAPYREYHHLIRIGEGWKMASAPWLP